MNIKLLKDKNFSLMMAGKLISSLGTQMQDFALSLYVLKKTGSAVLFASALIAALIPQLLLAPFAGVFVDWLDKKKIIVYLDILSGAITGLFAILYVSTGNLSLPGIYTLIITLTVVSVLYQPAAGTIIPSIVKKEDLVDANGISSLITNAGNLIAPLAAGIIFSFFGLSAMLLLNAFSFITAALGELFIDISKVNKMPEKINFQSFKADLSEGITFIRERKLLHNIMIIAPIINFVLSPLFSTGITYITKKVLQASDFQYGLLQMAIMASMILSPFIASRYSKKYTLGRILFIDTFISSVLIGIMAIVSSPAFIGVFNGNFIPYASLVIICFGVGAVIETVNIVSSSMLQKMVPVSMMGRVGTLLSTSCMASAPLGLLIFGFLFDNISAWACVSIAALILFAVILGFGKALLNMDENTGNADSPASLNEPCGIQME